jgi:hypothetical protein
MGQESRVSLVARMLLQDESWIRQQSRAVPALTLETLTMKKLATALALVVATTAFASDKAAETKPAAEQKAPAAEQKAPTAETKPAEAKPANTKAADKKTETAADTK